MAARSRDTERGDQEDDIHGHIYCQIFNMTHHTVVLNTQTNTNVGIQQEVVFATILPENPGSFKKFCELVRV